MIKINIIAAVQKSNRGIGYRGNLLFRIPEDMKRFRELTEHNVVVMGRKTWDSIPFGPLSNRINVVITRDKNFEAPKGVYVAYSIEGALERVEHSQREIFVIGGAEIYKQVMDRTNDLIDLDKFYLTEVQSDKEADVFMPEYEGIFPEVLSKEDHVCKKTGVHFSLIERGRKKSQ